MKKRLGNNFLYQLLFFFSFLIYFKLMCHIKTALIYQNKKQ